MAFAGLPPEWWLIAFPGMALLGAVAASVTDHLTPWWRSLTACLAVCAVMSLGMVPVTLMLMR